MTNKPCSHAGSWIVASGYWEWCWMCGALRSLDPDSSANKPKHKWYLPQGKKGKNPALKLI